LIDHIAKVQLFGMQLSNTTRLANLSSIKIRKTATQETTGQFLLLIFVDAQAIYYLDPFTGRSNQA
jgi:hypothetical protein